MFRLLIVVSCALAIVYGQNAGTQTEEFHPKFKMEVCDQSGCKEEDASITLDANWRWTHHVDDYVNCYTGNQWDSSFCPDPATCTQNCAVDGVDEATWFNTYGITSWDTGMELKFVTEGEYSRNVGSRLYLMAPDDQNYRMFYLKNKEFTFDVDVSNLGCGLNGAVYFVEMEEDGGLSKHPDNKAGAKFGTGYCDAQCPHDVKFIYGEANIEDWTASDTDDNAGFGKYGACCFEMDIWEANNMANSFTPHVCNIEGTYRCEGTDCGDNDSDERYDGVCDKDGCDWAVYRLGQKDFYGTGSQFNLDSTQPLTIVTQFITSDGTDSGDLVEVRRKYVQNGQVLENPFSLVDGMPEYDSVTDGYCHDIKDAFGDIQDFDKKGGLKAMGDAMERGFVLTLSLWDDHLAHMHWLDSKFPDDAADDTPGVMRGPCPYDGGDPADLEQSVPDASVKYFNIKIGEIDTTYPH